MQIKHLSIIPDGNRRWARKRGLKDNEGHKKAGAYDNLDSLCQEARKMGISCFSLWGFSTENWKRSKKEINEIFKVIDKGLDKFLELAEKNKYKIVHIGRKDRLPVKLLNKIKEIENVTSKYKELTILLGIDYGGTDEIVRAVNSLIKKGKKKVTEDMISNSLDTAGVPNPDLIIRTGGDIRTSGFMPFQTGYSEFYFTKKFFPAFTVKDLRKAVKEFHKRKRRFGGN